MAAHQEGVYRALPVASDLSASQYCAVVLNTSGQIAVAGANVRVAGILQDDPKTGSGTFKTQGRTKAKAGAAISLASGLTYLATDASGRVVTATTGQQAIGYALEAASGAGSLISIELGYLGTAP